MRKYEDDMKIISYTLFLILDVPLSDILWIIIYHAYEHYEMSLKISSKLRFPIMNQS